MDIFSNHKRLYTTATLMFVALTIFVAVLPALNNQKNNHPLPGSESLTAAQQNGKNVYIANGCVGCHTQQVRNVDMDKTWGSRPSIAADYAGNKRISTWINTATLMGTERTGPDLTNIGTRQSSIDWQLLHLYQPRAVVHQSIMPSYSFLFEIKKHPAKNDVVVNVPEKYFDTAQGKIVATKEALDLVAYLLSLKQVKLPDGTPDPDFLYKRQQKTGAANTKNTGELNGVALYSANCQSCHQENGEGLKGAFPPLKGSSIVNNDNPEIMINIIMKGYDARQDYGVMPPVGTNSNLMPEEVAAIINHERSSWGNNARKIPVEEVQKIMDFIKKETK
ncbi:MAG: cbb3-type cytochrome c oxidase subunit II [Ferruginibacter sp.]